MPNDAVLDALWRAHLGLSLGLMAVLLLRKPWRRLAGAQAAYALWLLPVWLASAALLPRASLPGWALPPVLVNGPAASALTAWPGTRSLGFAALWLGGVLAVAALLTVLHWRYATRLAPAPNGRWRAPAGDSPGLLGVWRPRLVLPADFRQRFDAAERRWILAHEAAHARRFDNPVRVLATAFAALAWFNPLAWWALTALRHDQELACDAAVMQRYPQSWRRYGLAMLKLDGACRLPPAASAWQPHHPLKERIMLLNKNAPAARVRRASRGLLAAGALLGLSAMQTLNAAAPKAADAKSTKQQLTVIQACTKVVRPEMPGQAPVGKFNLYASFRVGVDGLPQQITVKGDERLTQVVQQAISRYECKPELAGATLKQEFRFVFE